jgi:protein-disulfide isomerase
LLFFKRILLLLCLVGLGCSAQLAPTELAVRIERQLRTSYSVPETVKLTISAPHSSEFPNYEALTVTFDGDGKKQNYEFLLSKDQKTLIRMTKMDLSRDPYAETMKKIDLKGRPVRGNANAKVVAVNYDDLQCPFCARMHQTLFPELLKEYGDRVAFIYKDFPLSEIHPWAIHAAVDANCLAAQSSEAYWDFADYLHSNQQVVNSEKGRDAQLAALDRLAGNEAGKFGLDRSKLESCLKAQNQDQVNASVKEAESLGVKGTPTLFVNGQMIDGARSVAELRTTLDGALREAGVAVPAHPSGAAAQPSSTAETAAHQR